MAVKPRPDGYHTATPYLVVRGAAEAIDFYKKAFGAVEEVRMGGPGGSVMHAEIRIGDSVVMLCEENTEIGKRSPLSLGGSGTSILLYVDKVDESFDRVLSAGATVTMPLADMFWGDRFGCVKDPFGHEWSLATHVEDISPEEMKKRMDAMCPPEGAPPA